MTPPSGTTPIVIVRDLGRGEAEVLRGLLEAHGIASALSQEAVGSVVAVDVGAFGQVDVLVPAAQAEEARLVLRSMESGSLG